MVANLRIWNNLDISLIQIDLAKSLLSVLVPARTSINSYSTAEGRLFAFAIQIRSPMCM